MGHHFFQRRGAADADAEASDFAATVASLPPGVGVSVEDAVAPAAHGTEPAVESSVEHRPTLAHIGRYALKGALGMGGLGQVHEAWDPLLSRCVAVKTLHFDVEASQRVALDGLFLNEARAAAGLSHPNIVTIHDAGLSPQGVYIAMERLHGRDLRHAMAEGWQPTAEQAAQLVRRVAEALGYAHARGVVHCDIKPANIFLCRRDKPKVLDFGIARVARSAASRDTQALLDGLVAGSPHYLAPEQLRGDAVDARTDIHALGVVFYELLAGRKAFNGDTVEQISTAVLNNHPALAHELRPAVPLTLSLIAAKAMAQDPAERYSNAMVLAAELRRWAERQGVEADAADKPAPARNAHRSRRRTALITGGVVLATGGAALVGALAAAVGLRQRQEGVSAAAPVVAPVPVPVAAVPVAASAPLPAAEPPPVVAATPEPVATATAPAPAPAPAAAPAPAPTPQPNAAPARRAVVPPPPAPARAATPSRSVPAAAPVATGTLQLAISPWGEVEINGRAAGTTPPLTQLNLPEGTHLITVRNDDFPPYSTTVQVQAGRVATVRHRF